MSNLHLKRWVECRVERDARGDRATHSRPRKLFDIELFHRSSSGPSRLALTDAARAALPDLQGGFDLLSNAVERLKASKSRIIFTVTVPPAFAEKWLLWRVDRFQRRHPYYDLRIETSGRLVDFTSERIDIGIRYGAGASPDVTSTFLLRDEFFPVCSPTLLQGPSALREPSDLKHHALIHDTSMIGFGIFPSWRSWLLHAGYGNVVDTDRGLQLNDSAMAVQAAISGHGVALGRTTLVERDLAEGRLIKPFEYVQGCELAYYLVHRKESAQHAPVQAFKEWLLEEAGSG
ncbi:LysR substrate-binding domain-containing protein [Cupriavidus sp. 2TAF22]|uniref:LysR substrate-binding domain-containing protein n=1 Tax=unclassified Cupriavidus TaxID=2640874 RepID=UPI003F90481A